MAEVYPLAWPAGWARAKRRKRSQFAPRSLAVACDGVRYEVRLLGGRHLVISTNLVFCVIDGPMSQQSETGAFDRDGNYDPGAAAYWYDERAKARRVMACDCWERVRDNIHAIALSIGALRGLGRWGATEIVDRAFTGFAALPPAGDDWRSVLGLAGRPPIDEVKRRFRELAMAAHPDRPDGDPHQMVRLNQAMAAAERELQA